jgi:hypothetical protein
MHDILFQFANYVGYTGVILILIAYYYLSVGKWIADSMRFQFMNFLGAWFILYSLYFYPNKASISIEVAWIIISAVGMVRILSLKYKAEQAEKNSLIKQVHFENSTD